MPYTHMCQVFFKNLFIYLFIFWIFAFHAMFPGIYPPGNAKTVRFKHCRKHISNSSFKKLFINGKAEGIVLIPSA